MGSYSSQILPAAQSPGFAGLNSAISMMGGALNKYSEAALKERIDEQKRVKDEARKAANIEKYRAFAKEQGLNIEEGYTDKGPYFKATTPKPVALKKSDYEMAAAGVGPQNVVEQIAKEQAITPQQVAAVNPNAMMSLATGEVGDINENPIVPTAQDTRKYVAGAIPQVLKTGLPDDFKVDVSAAMEASGGDEEAFTKSLRELKIKYADNSRALTNINKILQGRTQSKSISRPSRRP